MRTLFTPFSGLWLLLLLSVSTAEADPDCGSVCIYNNGGFAATFKVKTNGVETGSSGLKYSPNGYACFFRQDLIDAGEHIHICLISCMAAVADFEVWFKEFLQALKQLPQHACASTWICCSYCIAPQVGVTLCHAPVHMLV